MLALWDFSSTLLNFTSVVLCSRLRGAAADGDVCVCEARRDDNPKGGGELLAQHRARRLGIDALQRAEQRGADVDKAGGPLLRCDGGWVWATILLY